METIKRESNGSVLGGVFKDGVVYKGDVEEYRAWVEDLELSLIGDTYKSEERQIPHGNGVNYTIYGDDETLFIWEDKEYIYGDNGEILEELYIFGLYE